MNESPEWQRCPRCESAKVMYRSKKKAMGLILLIGMAVGAMGALLTIVLIGFLIMPAGIVIMILAPFIAKFVNEGFVCQTCKYFWDPIEVNSKDRMGE